MDGRKKPFFSCFLFSAALFTVGCGSIASNQQSKFQMSFLPPAAHVAALDDSDLPKAPAEQPNVYLHDLPAFLLSTPSIPPRRTAADATIERAERRFEAGKKTLPGERTGQRAPAIRRGCRFDAASFRRDSERSRGL